MRILWLKSEDNPWRSESGWDEFNATGFEVKECFSVEEARKAIYASPAAFVCTHEVAGALEFLSDLRSRSSIPTVLVSFSWGKEEFRLHSTGNGAAHRYAKAPMPVEGFADMLAALLKVNRDDLLKREQTKSKLTQPIPEEASRAIFAPAPAPMAHSDEDVEALRKYLHLREQELSSLTTRFEETQKDYSRLQDERKEQERELRALTVKFEEEERKAEASLQRIQGLEKELLLEKENSELTVKSEAERRKAIDLELRQVQDRYESLKTRVRRDLRKIRVREKDLEAKLELMRTDSERMVEARDAKVLELQRKIDALEFDLDQLQDSRYQALGQAERYLARLARVSRTLHTAVSLIEQEEIKAELTDEADLLGGAAEGLEEELQSAKPARAAMTGGAAKQRVAAKAAPEADEGPDALLSNHKTVSVAATSSMAAAAEQEEAAAPFDLDSLASDGEPTQMISRPAPDAEAKPEATVEGLEDLASSLDTANRSA